MSLTDSLKRLPAGLVGDQHRMPAAPSTLERLMPCLPARLRRDITRRDRRLVVLPDGASARLVLRTGEIEDTIGTLTLAGSDPMPAAFGGKDRRRRTVLMLPEQAVLTRRASFPAQIRDNLDQALRSELSRLSPFQPDQVFYTFSVLPGARGEPRISVDLAMCRRDRVEAWIRRLAEAGAPVDELTWAGAWPRANLLPQKERPRGATALLEPSTWLLAVVTVLLAAVLITPLWQRTQVLNALDAELRRARSEAIEVDDLRQELEKARRGSTAVLQQKLDQPRFIDLLRELTERIPEDTWLQSLEIRDGEVQLRGESGRATGLIATLESAPGIDNVSFRSPVTQIARTGKERFNLAFTYRPEQEQ